MTLRTQEELKALLEDMLTSEGYGPTFLALNEVVGGHLAEQPETYRDSIAEDLGSILAELRVANEITDEAYMNAPLSGVVGD